MSAIASTSRDRQYSDYGIYIKDDGAACPASARSILKSCVGIQTIAFQSATRCYHYDWSA
jgi:hypothetical protein